MARSVLFSHPGIADRMNRDFECVWESLRPAPKVEIDFGNGHRLERTLNGNIATFFLDGQGGTFDIVPGLVDPLEYLDRLEGALHLHRRMAASPDARRVVVAHHDAARTSGEGSTASGSAGQRVAGVRLVGDAALLAQDTRYNREHRYPVVHALLAERPLASPRVLTDGLFRDLLFVDLADPFLGLAPDVPGGRLGRHGPNGALDGQAPGASGL